MRQIGTLNKVIAGRTKQEYNEENKEKIKETVKKYQIENREKLREYGKTYHEDNQEKLKQYWQDNNERFKETTKKYYEGLERAAPPHFGAVHDRRLSKPSPPMRLAGLNPHRREATRSGSALGQGP